MKHVPLKIGVVLFLLAGCGPSVEKVTSDAKLKLQDHLNSEFAGQHATVRSVAVVKLDSPRYQGEASIVATGSTFTVPVSVTSDGTTTVVAVDDRKLASEFDGIKHRQIALLAGKLSDYVLAPVVFGYFPATLKADRIKFATRLETVVPVELKGGYYFGVGCQSHRCTIDEAAWTLNKDTGEAVAIIMEYEQANPAMKAHKDFQIYGAATDSLPPPLAEWASQNGMNEMNSVAISPANLHNAK